MGMQNPKVNEPLDKLSEVVPEGDRFFLESIRTVPVKSTEYGEGEMVVVKIRGHERECGIWGAYLLTQAKSASTADLNQWYVINRRPVEGFGKGRPVKVFDPAPSSASVQAAMDDDDPVF